MEKGQATADLELRTLMAGYQSGDRGAVEELVRRLSPLLFRFLWHPDHPKSDTEDLLQDCWLRIHKARHTYRRSEPLLPWIFAIARHTRLDGYRRRQRSTGREVALDSVPETSQPAPRTDSEGEFVRLLESLPESQREVILMLKVSGMTLEEVARATSSTTGAVKQKAHRAYVTLRRMLAQDHAAPTRIKPPRPPAPTDPSIGAKRG